jgi:hypothetical protein
VPDGPPEPCAGRPCTGTGCSHEHAAIELTAHVHVDATFNKPAATEATQPRECPPGVHSLFDPCPGDCTEPVEDEPAPAADTGSDTWAAMHRFIEEMLPPRTIRARSQLTFAQARRRNRYAILIREYLKAHTFPSTTPGRPPVLGVTEHDLADVVLQARDDELASALAERDQLQRAVDAVRQYSRLTIDASTRVQACDQARDNLDLLDSILGTVET